MRARGAAALLCVAMLARAQEADNPHDAQPERPTVATHAYTVWPGWTEIEFGLELDHSSGSKVLLTPTTWKVGLAKKVQIEATTYFVSQSDGTTMSGFGDIFLALKWRLADSLPLLGSFAVQPSVELPSGSVSLDDGKTIGEFLLISSNQLGPVEVDINGGMFVRLNDKPSTAPANSTLWTVSAASPVVGSLGWTMEVFGFPGTHGQAGSAPVVGFLTGPYYAVHRWFYLDTGVIIPLDGPQPHAVYVGLTWNMGQLWVAKSVSAPSR
jgi:hypothetical protein